MSDKRSYIRVSEIGEWMLCSVAWQRRAEGVLPDSRELEAGREFHHNHGVQVARSETARAVKPWLMAAVVITGCALVACLVWGR